MIKNFCIIGLIVLLSSCARDKPVYNVESEPIMTGTGITPTLDQARIAIRRAVIKKTWRIMETGPNSLEANINKGSKVARVTIDYTTKSYSIRYKSSSRLLYDGSRIHRRYNSWIKGLRKTINLNFLLL
jgi:hypothetical protein